MSTEEFLPFRKFNDEAAAMELAELLKENGIEFIVDNSTLFDPSFANSELNKEYAVKLKQDDFEKATDVLMKISEGQIKSLPADYYLFEFTDDELYEILEKQDEWGQLDFLLAQKILKERGNEINEQKVQILKNKRMETLSHPEKDQAIWVSAGYILAFIGGALGIFIGHYLYSTKKTLPDGKTVYAFNESDRKNGFRIFIIGIIILTACVVYKLINVASH